VNEYQRNDYPERLTLEWLKHHNMPVFVRNLTLPRGQLTLNVPVEGGRIKRARIHRTHLPMNLSMQFSTDDLARCDDLRQCIYKGVIDLVRPDKAIEELRAEGALDEVETVQYSQYSAKQTFVSPRVKEMIDQVERATTTPSINELGVETHVIQPRVLSLVEKLKSGDISIKAAVSELKTIAGELSETDCSYLVANGPEGQVQTFAKKQLAHVRSKAIEENNIEPDELTPDELQQEARREALARQHQRV